MFGVEIKQTGYRFSIFKRVLARLFEIIFYPLTWAIPSPGQANPKRVLIAETYYLGDVANVSVMLDPLKARFPEAEIHLMLPVGMRGLFDRDPRVKEIYQFTIPWSARSKKYHLWRYDWQGLLHLVRRLRKMDFDIGFDTRGDIRTQLLLILSGCRRRVGATTYLGSNIQIHGLLLTNRCELGDLPHITRRNLQLCREIGCEVDQAPRLPSLYVPKDVRIGGSDHIVVHTGSGSPFRLWPLERWAELFDRLAGISELVLIGSPSERQRLEAIQALTISKPCRQVTETLTDLVDCIYQARLFVGLDSGPANVASLLGRPTVVLFGPGVIAQYHPISPYSRVIHHQDQFDCCPCSQFTCPRPNNSCMNSIEVGEVVKAVLQSLKELGATDILAQKNY